MHKIKNFMHKIMYYFNVTKSRFSVHKFMHKLLLQKVNFTELTESYYFFK